MLVGCKLAVEIDGEQGSEEIEGEKEHEITHHHLFVVAVPQLFARGSVGIKFGFHIHEYVGRLGRRREEMGRE